MTAPTHRAAAAPMAPPADLTGPRAAVGDPLIEFVGVQQSFGRKQIYEDLTLTIRRGETMTILGGSGTGKSVMLKLLIGLLKPDAGIIRFDGQDLVPLDENQLLPVRRRISMLFQGGALFDSISVGENVAYPLREHLRLSDAQIADRVAQKLSLVGLPGIETMRPAELSGGMRKRVAIARAIAADPEVVLYDEPTTGLASTVIYGGVGRIARCSGCVRVSTSSSPRRVACST